MKRDWFKVSVLTSGGCFVVLAIFAIFALIGAELWTYTVNTWLAFTGSPARLEMWQGAIMGFCPFIGQLSIPAAVFTFVAMLFLA